MKVGLTGGIGSGKSAAADLFAKLRVPIVDADVVAREVVQPGEPALQEIAAHFGADIIGADGQLDRRQLRGRIFSDPAEKLWLEALLHPLIGERIVRQLDRQDAPYTLLVSPLLLETEQHRLTDRVLLIDCPEDIQIARVTVRDRSEAEQVRAIMAAQLDRTTRRARADDIIENDAGLDRLEEQVRALHRRYLEMAAQATGE